MNHGVNPIDDRQIKVTIVKELIEIINDDSDSGFKVVQHLAHIMRKKGTTKEPYQWTDNDFLIAIQEYKQELDDLENDIPEDAL